MDRCVTMKFLLSKPKVDIECVFVGKETIFKNLLTISTINNL